MIKYINGDILKALENGDIDCFAHGVNCIGGFGSGIAGQIAKKYPNIRDAYIDKFKTDKWKLGEVQKNIITDGIIFNCATQFNCGYDGKKYVNYDAIYDCLCSVRDEIESQNLKLGLPKIGCGLAGGNWKIVSIMIESIFNNEDIIVYNYK